MKNANFKKCRRYVTGTENKTPPTLVFSKRFVTKRQPQHTPSEPHSLLNGSLPVKEFVFSKTVGMQLATLLNNELFHKYFSRSLTTSGDQLFCRTPLGICFYDYWYAPFISVGLEPQKQTTEGLKNYETLVDFAW